MSTSLEASTLNSPTTVSTPNLNHTNGTLDHSASTKPGLFVQRKRPVSLGSQADVKFKNIVQEYKRSMTSPVTYYRRSTDCFPSTPDPEVVIPDPDFLVEWYRENHWKVEAHDNARNQLLEILSRYLPGYGLGDSDPLDAYISVLAHYTDELNTKLNEFDIDIGQISGGEIAGRIESHKTRVFFIISRYKRMLDSANETIYQLRDRINHLDSELTGILQINASLRRSMANEDPGVEAMADIEGRAAAALALSSNLQQELQRSRRESQRLHQSVNQMTNQSLNTHEECMQVLAGLTQKVEINALLEQAIRNHINQLGASMDAADRIVEDWYNNITRALSERDLEIADLQQRVQYKNNELARLSAQHENLLRQSGELQDHVRRAKEAIMMQEAEVAKMEELGVNRTFTRPMNFIHSSPFEGSIPCGFGPTESTGNLGGVNLSSIDGGTFSIPAANRTVVIPAANRTVTVPAVNRTFNPLQANLTGPPLNRTQAVMTVDVPSTSYVVESPPIILNTTGRVSPVIGEASPAAVIGGGSIDESSDESFVLGPSVGKVSNTIDIGQGLNITTSVSGSPRALRQWATVDNLVPGSDSDSPQAMDTTAGYSSRDYSASSAGSGSPQAVITPWFIDYSDDFNSSGSADGRYIDLSKVIIPDEMVDDVFYLPGEPLEYPARLKNYRSENVQSFPRRRIYRKASPGKSIRRLSERQCITDWDAPTIDDMTQYTTMDNLSAPRGTYTGVPRGTYTEGQDRMVDSPMAVNTTVCISPRNQEPSASSAGSPPALVNPGYIGYSDDSYGSSGNGRYTDNSDYSMQDEMVDDEFQMPGRETAKSYPPRCIWRPPSPGKSIRKLSDRQCLTDWYAPTIADMRQYKQYLPPRSPKVTFAASPTYAASPRGTYNASPRGTYSFSPTYTNFSYPSYTESPPGAYTFSPSCPYARDSPLKKSVLLKTPTGKAPFVLDIDVQPQPIVQTESGEHIACDVSLDVQATEPVIKSDFNNRQRIFSYSTPPTSYSPPPSNLLGTPKSIFEKNNYAIRNLNAKFDELASEMNQMSPNRTLTPSPRSRGGSPDLDRTY